MRSYGVTALAAAGAAAGSWQGMKAAGAGQAAAVAVATIVATVVVTLGAGWASLAGFREQEDARLQSGHPSASSTDTASDIEASRYRIIPTFVSQLPSRRDSVNSM